MIERMKNAGGSLVLLAIDGVRLAPAAAQSPFGATDPADPRLNQGAKNEAVSEHGTGSTQIVWRDGKGRLHGVTDPRRLGYAEGH